MKNNISNGGVAMCNVSVITIFKRRHKKVKESLNSLINQTLPNVEIICIYKEENSEIDEFVKKTQEKYNNIKIIYKTKAQDVAAKNKALEEVQGKYILVMNGDMCLEKTALEKLFNAEEKNNTDIAICGYNIIDLKIFQSYLLLILYSIQDFGMFLKFKCKFL